MSHNQMKLAYSEVALEPVMSKTTIEYHFGKHYVTYLENYRKLIAATTPGNENDIYYTIKNSDGALFNNAAQVINHELFFEQFSPHAEREPEGELSNAINGSFGSFAEFKKLATSKATTLFGSGWVWLALDGRSLVIVSGSNAYNPSVENMIPLLAIDVWEHAYYLDYQNRRGEYLENIWKIIDWKIIEKRFFNAMEHYKL